MKIMRDGFENNLSIEQVKAYAKPELSQKQMYEAMYETIIDFAQK